LIALLLGVSCLAALLFRIGVGTIVAGLHQIGWGLLVSPDAVDANRTRVGRWPAR
jgi:hypothetical protein